MAARDSRGRIKVFKGFKGYEHRKGTGG